MTTPDRSRVALAAFMAGAGVAHFVVPGFYERIVPRWIGHEKAVVAWSGVAEVLCGALLAVPRTRRLGAWLTVVTLLAVYPANIQMAVDAGVPDSAEDWVVWARLPLQLPLLAWAHRHTRAP
ncbi:membrane protein [soil metagenome]